MSFGSPAARPESLFINSRFSEDVQAVGMQRGPPNMRGWKNAYLPCLAYAGPVTEAAVAGSPTRLGGSPFQYFVSSRPRMLLGRGASVTLEPGQSGGALSWGSRLELPPVPAFP